MATASGSGGPAGKATPRRGGAPAAAPRPPAAAPPRAAPPPGDLARLEALVAALPAAGSDAARRALGDAFFLDVGYAGGFPTRRGGGPGRSLRQGRRLRRRLPHPRGRAHGGGAPRRPPRAVLRRRRLRRLGHRRRSAPPARGGARLSPPGP